MFHPFHSSCHQTPAWVCMAAWLRMWGGNQGYGMYTSVHENQDVCYLLMDLSFSLSHLQVW
jgi:hypothetical protein